MLVGVTANACFPCFFFIRTVADVPYSYFPQSSHAGFLIATFSLLASCAACLPRPPSSIPFRAGRGVCLLFGWPLLTHSECAHLVVPFRSQIALTLLRAPRFSSIPPSPLPSPLPLSSPGRKDEEEPEELTLLTLFTSYFNSPLFQHRYLAPVQNFSRHIFACTPIIALCIPLFTNYKTSGFMLVNRLVF